MFMRSCPLLWHIVYPRAASDEIISNYFGILFRWCWRGKKLPPSYNTECQQLFSPVLSELGKIPKPNSVQTEKKKIANEQPSWNMIDYANRELEKPRNSLTHNQTFSSQFSLFMLLPYFSQNSDNSFDMFCCDAPYDKYILNILFFFHCLAGVRKVFAFFDVDIISLWIRVHIGLLRFIANAVNYFNILRTLFALVYVHTNFSIGKLSLIYFTDTFRFFFSLSFFFYYAKWQSFDKRSRKKTEEIALKNGNRN